MYRPIGATQFAKRIPAEIPVVEVSINSGLCLESVAVQLIANDMIAFAGERKLFFVLRKRVGKRARGAREHLLLAGAQRRLSLSDKLATRPGQHKGKQADEKQLPFEIHCSQR